MISIEEKDFLLNNLKKYSLNSFTIKSIVNYASISTDIFDIDHNILINNLSNNLRKNIAFSKKDNVFSNVLSDYNFDSKQITISSKVKNQEHITSLILHELDHVANYRHIHSKDKVKYLNMYLDRLNKKFSVFLRIPFVKSLVKKRFLNSASFSSGFNNPLVGKALGVNLNLFKEGITTYKQSRYEQYLNLSDKITLQNTDYKNELKVAKSIVDILGEDTVMQLEQNNDVLGLKKAFENITKKQVSFEELIHQLNDANIDSRNVLENQKRLDTTLQKIILCKKAYDYGIDFGNSKLSLNKMQELLNDFEKKIKFQNNLRHCTFQKANNTNPSPVKVSKDPYIK